MSLMTSRLNVGDRVKTTCKGKYSKLKADLFGTVVSAYSPTNIGVRLDAFTNARSERGLYYFSEAQLVRVGKDSETMDGNYRVAIISFLDDTSRTYRYACYDDSIEVGDICVVKSANHGFGIAKVGALLEKGSDNIGAREIVCKADFSAYNNRVETRKRREQLKVDMQKKAAQLQEIAVYQMLADKDPEMAAMLDEYKRLTDGND